MATGEACVHAFADFPREPFDPLDFSVEDAAETPSLADQLETGPSINVDESVSLELTDRAGAAALIERFVERNLDSVEEHLEALIPLADVR